MYQMGADMTLEVNRLARFTDEGTTPVDPGDFVSTVGHTRIRILRILPVSKLKLILSKLASVLYGHPLHLLQLDTLPAWIQ